MDAGLRAPEAELGTAPLLVRTLNGLSSLIRYGLTSCADGFGSTTVARDCDNASGTADGALEWRPKNSTGAAVVEELSLLLTAGRLNDDNKQLIGRRYDSAPDLRAGLVAAQELLTLSPEFSSVVENVPTTPRPQRRQQVASGKPYKATVVIFLNGGCDSYSTIVPLSECHSRDLYAEYALLRTQVTVPKERLLPINVSKSPFRQPCEIFGVHENFPFFKQVLCHPRFNGI